MYDLIIQNGTLVTPTSSFRADLAVQDGKISVVAGHIDGSAERVVDAAGMALLPGIVCAYTLCTRRPRTLGLTTAVAFTYLLVLAYNAAYMPMALNARSDIGAARAIDSRVPAGAPIYGVVPQDSLLRYYSINFYLGDRLRHCRYPGDAPDDAWIICSEADPTRPAPDTLSRRGADTRRPILLMAPRQLP